MLPRILIVDDSEYMRSGIRAMITKWRPAWRVCGEAANGEEAVQAVAVLKPDLVILDVSMPIMGGIEAATRIAALPSDARILLLTGYESETLRKSLAGSQSRAYVDKSHVIRELIPAMDTLLAKTAFPA